LLPWLHLRKHPGSSAAGKRCKWLIGNVPAGAAGQAALPI